MNADGFAVRLVRKQEQAAQMQSGMQGKALAREPLRAMESL